MTVLDRKLITRMVNPQPGGNGGGGGAGGAGVYVLPAASNSELGGIKLGYPTGTGKYYPVQLDDQQRAYVNVPWTYAHFGTDGNDYVPITIENVTKNVLTSHQSLAGYIPKHNIDSTNGNIPTWGTLTAANGYSAGAIWSFPGGSDLAFAYKSGQVSMQVDGFFYQNEGSYKVCDVGGFTMTGNIYIGNTTIYASGSNGGINSLAVADDCILGDCNIGGHLGLKSLNSYDAGISFYTMSGGGLGRVYTNGNFYLYNGSGGYASLYAQNGYAEGTWASKSDARMKNVVGDVDLTVEQIAAMPAVKFTWKNDPEKRVHIGTLAQPWQKVLPEAIETTQADTLMMCYGEAAMVSVIKLAQRVLELERMIKEK